LRNVEEHDGEQPEKEMGLTELRRGADPAGADDEKDLGEGEIEKTQRLF
jgi:hypothetical protein